MRWFVPPPHRTAYFSSSRQPGVVLRVSRIFAGEPAAASTNFRVSVATPLSRWRKFRAVRSAARIDRSGPATVASDGAAFDGRAVGDGGVKVRVGIDGAAHQRRGGQPGDDARRAGDERGASPRSSAGMVARLVRSPVVPRSSARASSISRRHAAASSGVNVGMA